MSSDLGFYLMDHRQITLGLLIGAVLLLIMDVNRPQRGRIEIGVDSLERVGESMATPVAHEGPGTV